MLSQHQDTLFHVYVRLKNSQKIAYFRKLKTKFFQVKKLFYQLQSKIGDLNMWCLEKIISHTGYFVESSSKYDNLVHNKII